MTDHLIRETQAEIHREVTSAIASFIANRRREHHIVLAPSATIGYMFLEQIRRIHNLPGEMVFGPHAAIEALKLRLQPHVLVLASDLAFMTGWRAKLTAPTWLHTIRKLDLNEAAQIEGRFNWFNAEFTADWAEILNGNSISLDNVHPCH